MRLVSATFALLLLATQSVAAQDAVGCYQFDRPWKVTLVRADSVFVGRALYLTDVIVPGEGPRYVDERARRVECPVRTDRSPQN